MHLLENARTVPHGGKADILSVRVLIHSSVRNLWTRATGNEPKFNKQNCNVLHLGKNNLTHEYSWKVAAWLAALLNVPGTVAGANVNVSHVQSPSEAGKPRLGHIEGGAASRSRELLHWRPSGKLCTIWGSNSFMKDIKKNFFTRKIVEHYNILLTWVESPTSEVFKVVRQNLSRLANSSASSRRMDLTASRGHFQTKISLFCENLWKKSHTDKCNLLFRVMLRRVMEYALCSWNFCKKCNQKE